MPVKVKPDTATVKDGMIFISGEPTGVIRSERKYTNFVLEYGHKLIATNLSDLFNGLPLQSFFLGLTESLANLGLALGAARWR